MATELAYSALAYDTRTGRVLYNVEMDSEPEWTTQINDPGSWKITVPLEGGASTARVREWAVPWHISIAIVRGQGIQTDAVCQAGPILPYSPDPKETRLTLGGKGFWELLNRRVLHNRSWSPTALITDVSADVTFTDSLSNIAWKIVSECTNYQNRPGSDLPVDLPAAFGSDGNTRTYHGYDIAFAGIRLQELTQVDKGPDVLFEPYISVTNGVRYIRHRMLVGNPYITQPGVPLTFDYGSNLVQLTIAGDGSNLANTAFVKGAGNEAGLVYGYATSTTLTDLGWPMLDMVDNNHSSEAIQATLKSWAAADVALYSNQPEQWTATVLADTDPRWGTYTPGSYVTYNVIDHHWLRNGMYNWRIIGVSNGPERDKIVHHLQAVRGS